MRDMVLVTGGSGGIGRAIVERVLRDEPGAGVVNLDLRPPAEAQPRETWQAVDFADLAATRTVLAEVAARHAPTRLVNISGLVRPAPLAAQTPEDLLAGRGGEPAQRHALRPGPAARDARRGLRPDRQHRLPRRPGEGGADGLRRQQGRG
jgi:hypothetical protein